MYSAGTASSTEYKVWWYTLVTLLVLVKSETSVIKKPNQEV